MKASKSEFFKDTIFHMYNRTVENENLFREESDYDLFLTILQNKMDVVQVSIFSYCLMPNHFHFLLRQDSDTPVYRLFNALFSSYVQKYNLKYGRKGALMAGPLQSKVIDKDDYLLNVSRYIHLNPVKAGLVSHPEDWKYSNFREWVGIRKGKLFNNLILNAFYSTSDRYKETINEYSQWMDDENFKKTLFDNR